MNILGIAGQESNASAALIVDGRVVAVIEEEKLARIRYVGINYAGGLPERAVQFCLERAGLTLDRIDYVGYYLEPYRLFHREIAFQSARATQPAGPGALEPFPDYFVDSLNRLKQHLKTRQILEARLPEAGRFVNVNHQMAHAASAFYVSGFDRAAILIADHRGDMTTTALMSGAGARINTHAEAEFPNSIGLVYNAVTAALGFAAEGDWHKTMWLAPTGEPEFLRLFEDLLAVDQNGLPVVNADYFDFSQRGGARLSEHLFERAGLRPRAADEAIGPRHRNLAASLQMHVEDVLCDIAVRLRTRSGETNLCMAGGVALNGMAMSAVERRAGYRRLFVQPAAGNAGTAVGAALAVWHQTLGREERPYEMRHVFLGPRYDDDDIKSVLDNCKLDYEYFMTEDKLLAGVTRLLADNRIVGWFRGAMEFGPRALGARSILASPASELMRDNLNAYIKRREDFRPFSASVPEERVEEFFEPSGLAEFLQGVSRVRHSKRGLIPAALFGEGLVRVHSVRRDVNSTFWRLLVKFGEVTGAPVLLNTSFNLFGEPVVSTPREAVRGFYCSGIDALAIGNFLIRK